MSRLFLSGLALALCGAMLAAPTASAQDMAPEPQVTIDFEDAELDAFAHAYVEIEDLQMRYQAEYGEVDDPAAMQQIQDQFHAEATEAIEESGISVERYEAVIMATQADPEFAQEVLERVEAIRVERAG